MLINLITTNPAKRVSRMGSTLSCLAVMFLSQIANAAPETNVVGEYGTYNESGFNFKLSLNKGGVAKYLEMDLEGGEPAVLNGKWQYDGNKVVINFPKDGKYIYTVQSSKSWQAFNCQGASFGLGNLSTPKNLKPDSKYDVWLSSDIKSFEQCRPLSPSNGNRAGEPSERQIQQVQSERNAVEAQRSQQMAQAEARPTDSPKQAGPIAGLNAFLKNLTTSVNSAAASITSSTTGNSGSQAAGLKTSQSHGAGQQPGGEAPSGMQQDAVNQASKNLSNREVPSINATALSGLFAKHPWDGTPNTTYPKVAVTVQEWSRSDCWTANATIWRSKSKSEVVGPFSVCWPDSFNFHVNNAVKFQLFIAQLTTEHSGNIRSRGPKPPSFPIPLENPIPASRQNDYKAFIMQLVLDSGWQPGAQTNIWLVDFNSIGSR